MELTRPADPNTWQAKLVTSLGKKFRSQKSYSEAAVAEKRKKETAKLQKKNPRAPAAPAPAINELGERNEYAVFGDDVDGLTLASSHKTKRVDHGDMMHRLAHHDSFDSLLDKPHLLAELRDPYFDSHDPDRRRTTVLVSEPDERRVASLPAAVWKRIATVLDSPVDAANLALASTTLLHKLHDDDADADADDHPPLPLAALNVPANRHHRHAFLHQRDRHFPDHLLCFPCARFHPRAQPGREVLKADFVQNPVFRCPRVRSSVLPRMRLVHGRELPYAFVQLALRHARHGARYGVAAEALARRWRCRDSGWQHRTRYLVHDGRLLLRVVSSRVTPPATELTETASRHLLFDREEYLPFFSACAHWRDGLLTRVCKCMMSHVPAPPDPLHRQLRRTLQLSRAAARPDFLVRGCDDCRPARRCPDCPSEYLVEVQMREDPRDPIFPFKHALVVTRWTDLGDGSSPYTSPEWIAINGLPPPSTTTRAPEEEKDDDYDSFQTVGRRAIGGIFESNVSGEIPGQRLISLNPSKKRLGEEGHGWY